MALSLVLVSNVKCHPLEGAAGLFRDVQHFLSSKAYGLEPRESWHPETGEAYMVCSKALLLCFLLAQAWPKPMTGTASWVGTEKHHSRSYMGLLPSQALGLDAKSD